MNELLTAFTILGVALTFIALVRILRRISRGSESAGPRHLPQPLPVGQKVTPWELEAIGVQLQAGPSSAARQDLIATVNRLAAASNRHERVHESSTNAEIDRIISLVEYQLQQYDSPTGDPRTLH